MRWFDKFMLFVDEYNELIMSTLVESYQRCIGRGLFLTSSSYVLIFQNFQKFFKNRQSARDAVPIVLHKTTKCNAPLAFWY